jgi:KaiC/GvpD/RAD55 family RecA-like ATPase
MCVLWCSVAISKVREVFLGWGLRDDEKVESNVTAAYATITYRLRVVVTRLSAAAFWLGVWK